MKKEELLDIELTLLLIKYGEKLIIKKLAKKLETREDILKLDLLKIRTPSRSKTLKNKETLKKPYPSTDTLNEIGHENRGKLGELIRAFDEKKFAPELKDVKRIFEKHKGSSPTFKSRLAARPYLIELLRDLSEIELRKFIQNSASQNHGSSLGIISDEILRRKDESEANPNETNKE